MLTTSNMYGNGDQPQHAPEVVFDSKPAKPKVETTGFLAVEQTKSSWVVDIANMHSKFAMNSVVREFDDDKLKAFLEFRIKFLQEELDEMRDAQAAEDVVDALIDLIVVAIGTLNLYEINSDLAWQRVLNANMAKQVGTNRRRNNALGLPDLIKPQGWQVPRHTDNCGLLTKIYKE